VRAIVRPPVGAIFCEEADARGDGAGVVRLANARAAHASVARRALAAAAEAARQTDMLAYVLDVFCLLSPGHASPTGRTH
jgi:hypothetical protein